MERHQKESPLFTRARFVLSSEIIYPPTGGLKKTQHKPVTGAALTRIFDLWEAKLSEIGHPPFSTDEASKNHAAQWHRVMADSPGALTIHHPRTAHLVEGLNTPTIDVGSVSRRIAARCSFSINGPTFQEQLDTSERLIDNIIYYLSYSYTHKGTKLPAEKIPQGLRKSGLKNGCFISPTLYQQIISIIKDFTGGLPDNFFKPFLGGYKVINI